MEGGSFIMRTRLGDIFIKIGIAINAIVIVLLLIYYSF